MTGTAAAVAIEIANEVIVAIIGASGVVIAALVARSTRKVDQVDRELRPNGGNSLRDAIDRTETRLTRMETSITARQDRIEARIDHLAERVDDLITQTARRDHQ